MTVYVALLRAINVGGTGKLRMEDLRALCTDAGFSDPQTYLASGNVVFVDKRREVGVKKALEARLTAHFGKPAKAMVRSAESLAAVLAANPFRLSPPSQTIAILLDDPAPTDTQKMLRNRQRELVHVGHREIYVTYPDGIGRSRLRIPAADLGTARNMNTIAALIAIAAAKGASSS